MNTAQAINLMPEIGANGLRDLIDLLDYMYDRGNWTNKRRKGLTPIDDLTLEGRAAAVYEAAGAMDETNRAILRAAAVAIRRSLQPVTHTRRDSEGNPLARGYLEIKYIRRPRLNLETGEIVLYRYGPYLYWRHFAGGGGIDRKQTRLETKYIGEKELAILFETGRVTADQILEALETGTLEALKASLGIAGKAPNKSADPEAT